jgi:hypothetical protein
MVAHFLAGLLLAAVVGGSGGVDHRAEGAQQREEDLGDWNRPPSRCAGGGIERRLVVGTARRVHGADDGGDPGLSAVRPKHLAITGADVQPEAGVMLAAPSISLRDALTTVGLSFESAAVALGCSASRVQAKCDPKRIEAPVTWADVIWLARAGGKARDAAQILHAELGAAIEDSAQHQALQLTMLPMAGMQFAASAMEVGATVQAFVGSPSKQARTAALRAIGSAWRSLTTLHAALGAQRL